MKSESSKLDAIKHEPVKNERRAMARYRDKLPVAVKMDESLLEANAIEVSQAGIRIECEGAIANHIFKRYIQVMPGENVTANLDIKVMNENCLADSLKSKAKLVSVNRAAQSRYIVGFEFLEFIEGGLENWQAYIATKILV